MIKKNTPTTWPWRIAASLLLAASLTTFVACEKQQQENMIPPPPPPSMEIADDPSLQVPDDNGVFDIVEDGALPVGGMQAFYQHLSDNIQYPKEAMEAGVEGTAYIRFIVDEQGNVTSAEAIKKRLLGYGLDEEAIRVVKTTKWIPAKQRGIIVKHRMVLPIKFKLKSAH